MHVLLYVVARQVLLPLAHAYTRWVTLLWMHLFFGALQHIDRYRSGILGFLLWLNKARELFLKFRMHPSLPPNHRFDHAGLHHSDRGGPDHADAQRSCLGPKSQDCCRTTCYKMNPIRPALMWCLFLCLMNNGVVISEAAIDARVGFADHRSNPGATTCSTPCSGWAKQGEYRHIARPSQRQSHRETVRKRALLRAINRADRNPSGQTWYNGRLLHRTQLGPGLRCTTTAAPRPDASTTRRERRLRLVSWNAGGLMDTRNQEVQALAAEAQAGRPVDIMTLQETCWKQDLEYRTSCGPTISFTQLAPESRGS